MKINCVSSNVNRIFRYGRHKQHCGTRTNSRATAAEGKPKHFLWFLSLMNVQKADDVNVFGPFITTEILSVCARKVTLNPKTMQCRFSPSLRRLVNREQHKVMQPVSVVTTARNSAFWPTTKCRVARTLKSAHSLSHSTFDSTQHFASEVTSLAVCVSAVTSSCSLNFSRTLATKDPFMCQQLNTMQPSS